MTDNATPDRVRWLLMELGHGDVRGRYSDLRSAKEALSSVKSILDDSEDEFGVVEVDEAGYPVGEVIR